MSNPYIGWNTVELIDEMIIARLRQQKYASERDFKTHSAAEALLAEELNNIDLIKEVLLDALKS